ncbi:hypothetical protein BH10ACI3_BH10ACI3_01470 [soil metagenome]
MKAKALLNSISIITAAIFVVAGIGFGQTAVERQNTAKTAATKDAKKKKTKVPAVPIPAPTVTETPADGSAVAINDDDDILPYYKNYLKEYRLGPSDMISIEVFGQCPDYCKTGISVPPNARISYPLIRDGIMVAGRTVEQVAAEITKKLDEFIIDPKVTVTLDKAVATRYSVMGGVATPGVRVMDKKISVYEAILEAGGVTKDGNRDKVFVISYTKQGTLSRKQVSMTAMEAGKAEMVYLSPGDQVFVTGKGFTLEKFMQIMGAAAGARVLF